VPFAYETEKETADLSTPVENTSTKGPRDLQFRGPFVETRNSILKQNCHLDRSVPGFPHAAQDATSFAAFIKESSMNFRQRHQPQQEIRGSAVERPAVPSPMGKRLSTKGTASAVPKQARPMRALAPEVRLFGWFEC